MTRSYFPDGTVSNPPKGAPWQQYVCRSCKSRQRCRIPPSGAPAYLDEHCPTCNGETEHVADGGSGVISL